MDQSTSGKKVLILGAGRVAEPVIEYLTRDKEIKLIVASVIQEEANTICKKYPFCQPLLLDVTRNPEILDHVMKEVVLVISLLPGQLHSDVIKRCIKHKTNMVTASYCSPAMQELHEAAVDAGITVMNEVGLDPGIDHLLAMKCFHEVKQRGGIIKSFVSYCGGLPAPECSDNPLRYKFTWFPKGALQNTLSGARYLKDGRLIEITPGGALLDCIEPFKFSSEIVLEGSPNRDSTIYRKLYEINDATTILRGTLRYQGFFDMIKGLQYIGLLDTTSLPSLRPDAPPLKWRDLISILLGQFASGMEYDELKALVTEKVRSSDRMEGLEKLGLLSSDLVVKLDNPIDTLSNYLATTLALQKGERDLVVLRHEIQILWPDEALESREINLICYGDTDGYTAMSKTVGYTVAIAAKMVLEGRISAKGMVLPFKQEIFEPMLSLLAKENIKAVETIKRIN